MNNSDQTSPEPPTAPEPRRFRVRLWHIVFLVLVIVATFSLAWWQWTRFRSGSGSFQNLGYALQWPFFGGFFVYAYRKLMEYENQRYLSDSEFYGNTTEAKGHTQEKLPFTTLTQEEKSSTEIDESFLPQPKTLTVEEFNQLNQQKRRR
ncbi:hypothetical protein LJU02_08345 [Corynebacterium pseudotuberculosis]|uniref:hypothetical protein n=1 Tax=Corynebacterium pseudotuberculosis TaxID=1719 RepID=UPI000232478D|nr:hypothetical protein [Corynebacterium pseudotuberculosis]AER69666.1 Hypothetical protein Cp106_1611 [Corynebacterium pseudotuberculosis 1/06-A]AFB72998.1 hypothetical protein CP316_08450 [Corynebacterium pseudotuberculosis 316]AFH91452.1 hypothetical protein CP31_08670 [Corynebacterium pseudotuberculosis 31]AKS13983.1 Hypohtetical protein [Corynebacterium pseudotuberculosis]AMN70515.1 hypothetical protein ATN02_08750 [Corynebacterium pseudotuberculosis]